MGTATHEQAELLLKLYDLRREPLLRQAREWFDANFHPKSQADVNRLCLPGSQEHAYMRMVLTYWDMAASLVNHGLIGDELFFENTGQLWNIWQQVKPVVGEWRAMFSSPKFLANLEQAATRLGAWRDKREPGASEAIGRYLEQISQAAQAKAQAAD